MSEVKAAPAQHHLLALRVENKAGVLVRIAGLFARRGFNIYSLAVAPSDDERFSRVSMVVSLEQTTLQQVLDQLEKLVNVVEITELHPFDALEAELLLATVRANGQAGFDELLATADAKIVDRAVDAVTVMAAAHPDRLDELEAGLSRFGIIELHRTGRVALPKLSARDDATASVS